MARVPAGLPAGVRLTDHISLGVIARTFPIEEVRRVLAETGRSRSRSLVLPVSARTSRTWSSGNVPAITPRLMWSLTRMPAGKPPAGSGHRCQSRKRQLAAYPFLSSN